MRCLAALACALAGCAVALPEHEFNGPESAKKDEDQLSCMQLGRSQHAESSRQGASSNASQEEEKGQWVFCASQWQDCTCRGDVRWGEGGTWKVKPLQSEDSQTVKCSFVALGDPIPGRAKHCECFMSPRTPGWKATNPMLLSTEVSEVSGAKVVANCSIFQEAQRSRTAWDIAQWQAVAAFCSPEWAGQHGHFQAGHRALSIEKMQSLMEARVDPRFADAYHKYSDEDGWIPRAFVNYFAATPQGNTAKETIELIRSIHLFSEYPVVAVNFGMSIPDGLDPQEFPRLVLLHARPLDAADRSFNFNKFRGFLLSRVKVGVGLDSDQYVAPMVDNLFNMTEREINEGYPFPIMPVHFLDWNPQMSKARWWQRICPPKQPCTFQTMRWGHAHPTWTFHALPFLGRWLRKNFRDETLPAVEGEVPELHVKDIPEDEDLLNIGLWEERATKQWCKWDLPDPVEFEAFFRWRPGGHVQTGDITDDKRFYKHGAVKLFYTAHHAVHPNVSAIHINRIHDQYLKGMWPNSGIVFNKRLWTAEQLHQEHPDMGCLF